MKKMRKISDLPFVKTNGKELHIWAPEVTGDYQKDCATGNAYAAELVKFMEETGNPTVFAHIVKAMPAKTGAVEIGFLTAIAMKAVGLRYPAA